MDLGLAGKVVLITGGSKGIGFACARAFAGEGAKVAIVSRDPANLARAREQLAKAGYHVHLARADLHEAHSAQDIVEEASSALGPIDILINSAGAAKRYDPDLLDAAAFKAANATFASAMAAEIKAAGYPAKADDAQINKFMVWLLLTVLVIYVTMVYGPIAAMLVELFPTRIRYTSMSLPYHIGNGWFGGFLPPIAFALVAFKGNIYYGLWYPIIVAVITLIVGTLFLRETKDVDIYADT